LIKILLLCFLALNIYAKDFTIASYNAENLFDLKKQNSEYKEFIPNTASKWNQRTFNIKINNAVKVIKDINADIIALQEIENRSVIQLLLKKLPAYKYSSFVKYSRSSVGVGFLSKIKIKNNRQIDVKFTNKIFRPILETTFELENKEFKIFNNHWPSKRTAESYRLKFAKKLQDRLSKLPKDYDYILLGDFNSNYDEDRSFRHNSKLNNTKGITGINQVLNTTVNNRYITYDDVLKQKRKVHFNLWLDLPTSDRFSNKYRTQSNTPDNIILSPALLDTKNISYIHKSFKVFKPSYLYKNKKVLRWQMKGSKYNKVHVGAGYSDHLPIYAKFSTSKEKTNPIKQIKKDSKKELNKISDLYNKMKLVEPAIIKNAVVIYKSKTGAIIKQKNDRAIYIYKHAQDLKIGYSYTLQINEIIDYHGLKEVDSFSILNENGRSSSYKSLILDARKIDILNEKYQNEIVSNLKGTIKNKKLYIQNSNGKRIKVFAKNKLDLPKNNTNITFTKAHIAVYRGNPQILIHSSSDYKVGN
jgi:hypothetical protein